MSQKKYSLELVNRVREKLKSFENIKEIKMMGGITFMLNSKMCIAIIKEGLMCRIDPQLINELKEKTSFLTTDLAKRRAKGFILIEETEIHSKDELNYWIDLAVTYNPKAKSSKSSSK